MKKIITLTILIPLFCNAMEKRPREKSLEKRMEEAPAKRQSLESIRTLRDPFKHYFFNSKLPYKNDFEHNSIEVNKQIRTDISTAIEQLKNIEDEHVLQVAPKLLQVFRQTLRSLTKVYDYLQQQIAYQQNPSLYEKPRTHAMTVAPMGTTSPPAFVQRRRAQLKALRSSFQAGSLRLPPQPGKKQ